MLESLSFEKAAPYLKDPLVLVGFVLLLFFALARALIRSRLLTPITGAKSYRLLQTVLAYGFVLGILVVLLGFGLKYRELSEAEQRRTVGLLQREFDGNVASVESIRRNVLSLLPIVQQIATSVRRPDLPALSVLFPNENVESGNKLPPRELALKALMALFDRHLDTNKSEMAKADAAAKAIHGTVERTRPTVLALCDSDHVRYVINEATWSANLPILRQIQLEGIPALQEAYASARKLRSDYDVVCSSVVAYLDAVRTLFEPKIGVNLETLTAALGQEQQSLSLISAYGANLADALDRMKALQAMLAKTSQASAESGRKGVGFVRVADGGARFSYIVLESLGFDR